MAQRHEIEAWVNPSAWDDEAAAWRAVHEIEQTGSDDEAIWTAIVQRIDGVSVEDLAQARADALGAAQAASDALRARMLLEASETGGRDKAMLARRASVTRKTLDAWLAGRSDQ